MKTDEYFLKRSALIESQGHKDAVKLLSNLEARYQEAAREIEKEILAFYTRYATQEGITLSEAKRILTASELKEFRMGVKGYIKMARENELSGQWVAELERASTRARINRLYSLQISIQQRIESLYKYELDAVSDFLFKTYAEGYYQNIFTISQGSGVALSFATVDHEKVLKILNTPWTSDKVTFSSRIWGNKEELKHFMSTQFPRDVARGIAPKKTARALANKVWSSGGAGPTMTKHGMYARAENLVLTEHAYFSSEASHDAFKEIGVEKYKILATLDSRTSEICQDMDSKVFKMSERVIGATAPPFHNRCRTTTVPVVNADYASKRAARDENGKRVLVPSDWDYKTWKEKLDAGEIPH